MARNVQTLYRPICHPTGNARQKERRHPFDWAQPQKLNPKSPGSHSQRGVHQAGQCQHPSPPAAGAHASRPRLLTPQDGALLGRLQNQTFRLAGLASRRKLFLLYSRKRHWKTLITYQRRCRARGTALGSSRLSSPPAPGWHLLGAFAVPAALGWPSRLRRLTEHTTAGEQSQIIVLALAKALLGAARTRNGAGIENPVLIYNGTRAHREIGPDSPLPRLGPAPTPPAVKKCFQICRLNTFFVHFRPFTLYPTGLGSSNIFPSFDHSISWRVFIGWDASLTELLLSYTAQI